MIELVNALIPIFQIVFICGVIFLAFITGFRMGRHTMTSGNSLKIAEIKNEDKNALNTEDEFSELINITGIADADDRIKTL